VIVAVSVECVFDIVRLLTCRCVDAAGEPTIVVVVAETIEVLVLPGVNVVVVLSAHDACTVIAIAPAPAVTKLIMSLVPVNNIVKILNLRVSLFAGVSFLNLPDYLSLWALSQ
jgi:hypothetical protein